MSKKATVPMLAAFALAAPLLAGSVTTAPAADKGGLISIIVIDPANPYWLTEGKVAAAEAREARLHERPSVLRRATRTPRAS